MPELPEVENVARTLRPRIVGRRIAGLSLSGLPLRRRIDERALRRACIGATVDAVRRVGKYLLFELSSDSVIVAHLGMSGRFVFSSASAPRAPHTHAIFDLEAGLELRYIDPRRFGVLAVYPAADVHESPELSVLGPDPLDGEFSLSYFAKELASSRRDLKNFLLDQGRIAGLGNIYVCEALFRAKLSPRRRADRVRRDQAERLHAAILDVLADGVRNRGTSFSDYVDANGEVGSNQESLLVYGREGARCRSCRAPIRRIVQGARSTFYCSKCQK